MRSIRRPAAALLALFGWVAAAGTAPAQEASAFTYIGVTACAKCHRTEKSGNQFAVWEQSKHAKAYELLTTAVADSIAQASGLTTKAAESETCLACHTTGGPSSGVARSEGISCEACHNAGSGYKALSVMKDKAKAVESGLRTFADPAAIEAFCRTCHNEKSPTTKEFNFEERWAKIKHMRPADG
jgi:hypothetical protein